MADNFVADPQNSQELLRHYALIEKARLLRQKHKELLAPECQDRAHEDRLLNLQAQLDECEKRLAMTFSRTSVPTQEEAESQEELQSFIEYCPPPKEQSAVDNITDSDEYMDKLIAENKVLTEINCQNLKTPGLAIYQMFKFGVPFEAWFESRQAYRIFYIIAALITRLLEIALLVKITSLPPSSVRLHFSFNLAKIEGTVRSEIAAKFTTQEALQFERQVKIFGGQLAHIAANLGNHLGPDGELTSKKLFLVWEESKQLYGFRAG